MKIKQRALEKSEVLKIIDKAKNNQLKAIISMMILTGARISEILELRARDVWTDENYLYIRMIVLKKRESTNTEIIRKVPKGMYFVIHIKKWINEDNEFQPDDFLFEYRRQTVWKYLKEIEPDINPHLFRHTLATWMGRRVDAFTLKDWFKWSNLNMATKYVHNKDSVNAFANAMEEL
jgi:integrase